jgi:plastocyanin
MRKLLIFIAALTVLALPASSAAATIQIKITSTAFTPKTPTINQNDTVTWTNSDTVNHQLVANDGTFASPILKRGQSYSFTFKTAGKVDYHDALKPALKGTITIKGPPPSVTVGVSMPIVVAGGSTTLSGAVSNGKANEPVLIFSQPYGGPVTNISTIMTGTAGTFSYTTKPDLLTSYYVRWKTTNSQTVSVQVRPKLTLSRFSKTRFFARVEAAKSFAARSIYLHRRSQFGQWVIVGKYKLGPNSGRIFNIPHKIGTYTYRVYMSTNQAGAGFLEGWSNSSRVRFAK